MCLISSIWLLFTLITPCCYGNSKDVQFLFTVSAFCPSLLTTHFVLLGMQNGLFALIACSVSTENMMEILKKKNVQTVAEKAFFFLKGEDLTWHEISLRNIRLRERIKKLHLKDFSLCFVVK